MAGLAFVVLAFILMFVVAGVLLSFDAEAWITKGLERGDLYSLTDVASGLRPDGLTPGQARRLQARGMVRGCGKSSFRATMKGKLALRIRRAIRQTA